MMSKNTRKLIDNSAQGKLSFSICNFPKIGMPIDWDFLLPLKPTVVFHTYWKFAVERQNIFFRRVNNHPFPWTEDPILLNHKFTNAYRASDRASQYLIKNVIYNEVHSPVNLFFRTILFKIFNRIQTWELLLKECNDVRWENYNFDRYEKTLGSAMDSGKTLYSAAYIMPSGGPRSIYARKHQMHLRLLEKMINEGIVGLLSDAKSMSEAFTILRSYPTIGDFLAYQYVIDLNYSPLLKFGERDFVVPGPGARDGIKKCFSSLGGMTEAEVISFIASRQGECFAALGLKFPSLWGRSLQLVDCQNLFCEVDKYARVAHPEIVGLTGRTRIKQKLRPTGKLPTPWYPPKWGINERIKEES